MKSATSSITIGPGQTTPTIEARLTSPDYPGYDGGGGALAFAFDQLGLTTSDNPDRTITEAIALTYSAVWACVRFISQSIASLNWHVYERSADGRRKLPVEDNIAWTLGVQPNYEVNAFDFRQTILKDALTWGNGYAEIERLGSGRPWALWRISPDRVWPYRDEDGKLYYGVSNGSGRKDDYIYMRPEDVFHLKGLGPDGIIGYSVVTMARRAIQLGLQEERFGTDFFSRGPMPGGVLSMPGKQTPEQTTQTRRDFQNAYSGSKNRGRVVVLHGGMTFSPLDLPNDDAQYLESRSFQVTEIARWYGVPPHKIGDLARSTFSNIEQQNIEATIDCLRPWARRLEMEADVKLYPMPRRARVYTSIDLDPLMRGDSMTQAETVTKKVAGGIVTPNEGREYFGMDPLPDGDTLLVQGAMVTLETVVNPPEPVVPAPPAPVAPDGTPAQPQPDTAAARRVFGSLLADTYARLLRVEADKARRADKQGKLPEHVAERFADEEWGAGAVAALRPVFAGLLLALGRLGDGADALALAASQRHAVRCVAALKAGGAAALADSATISAAAAEEDLRGVM